MNSQRYLLKVFSGPHLGAEALLAPGDYEIGRSDQCDIIFNDAAVAPRHARISISSDGMKVAPIDQSLLLDGNVVDESGDDFQCYQAMAVGTTFFAIGIQDEEWPSVRLFETSIFGGKENGEQAGQETRTGANRQAGQNDQPIEAVYSWFKNAAEEFTGLGVRRVHVAGAFGLLLSFTVFGFALDSGEISKGKGGTKAYEVNFRPLEDRVKLIMDKLNLSNLAVTRDNGQIRVKGYLTTLAQNRALDDKLRSVGSTVRKTVWVGEEQVASANAILTALGLGQLKVSDGGQGVLLVSGYVADIKDWQKAQAILRKDVPGVRKINEKKVETLAHREKALRGLLAREGLDDKLDVATRSGRLVVKGALSEGNMERLKDVVETFEQRHGGGGSPLLRSEAVLLQGNNKDPELSISGIVASGNQGGFVLSKSGKLYREGDVFPDGFRVKSIEPRSVVLSRNNQTVIRFLSGAEQ